MASAVFITGGARRIGAALVRAFHASGANVVVHYHRSQREAGALASELNQARADSVRLVRADLLETAALPRLVNEAAAAYGRLDVLVNNASSFYPTPLGKIDEEAWRDLIGTNLKAPLFLAQAAAPALRASRGLILNLADIHGLRPLTEHPLYSAAKAGLIMLTKALARELAPDVRVNAIAPGPVLWPENLATDVKAKILANTPLGRPGSPEDVARAALYFANDAPYVTGQILAIDGGRSI